MSEAADWHPSGWIGRFRFLMSRSAFEGDFNDEHEAVVLAMIDDAPDAQSVTAALEFAATFPGRPVVFKALVGHRHSPELAMALHRSIIIDKGLLFMKLLLEAKADPNGLIQGISPLQSLVRKTATWSPDWHARCVLLLEHKATPTEKDVECAKSNYTARYLAKALAEVLRVPEAPPAPAPRFLLSLSAGACASASAAASN